MISARWQLGLAMTGLVLALIGSAGAHDERDASIHLGVASCAGDNCHGAVQRMKNSHVMQDEYLIWVRKDHHSKAFAALRSDAGLRIAKNLGLPDAEHADLCLGCHADNVPARQRGEHFNIADGVGCETCHGGASGWLGTHISGEGHAANVRAGLYPLEQPFARAERCLACHLGSGEQFVNHRVMGAGHPPLGFELDTYSAIQPAHFHVDEDYIRRKGVPDDIQIWAAGQAADVIQRMDRLRDPKNTPKWLQPELALFDCEACHHSTDRREWRPRASTGLPPGNLRIYDATVMMLQIIAVRLAPELGQRLRSHLLALHQATATDWSAVQREASVLRQLAEKLVPIITEQAFGRDDAIELAHAIVRLGADGDDLDYSAAQQQTMALASIVAAMKTKGFAEPAGIEALSKSLTALYDALAPDRVYRPAAFAKALRQFAAVLPP